jgi:hypothetical protein
MPSNKDKYHTPNPPKNPVSDSKISAPAGETKPRTNNHVAPTQPEQAETKPKKPQTINIGKIPKIDVIEGEEANRIAKQANTISIWAIVISALLFIATLLVFYQTVRQTNSSIISANAAKKSADLQKQSLDSQLSAKKQSDIADAQKLKRDTDFINKQKQGIDAQITSFNKSQKEFDVENKPLIQVGKTEFADTIKTGKALKIAFSLENFGRQPIKIEKILIKLDISNNQFYKDSDFAGIDKIKKIKRVNMYIPGNNRIPVIYAYTDSPLTPEDCVGIQGGKTYIFLVGEVVYINTVNLKKEYYRFDIRISPVPTYNVEFVEDTTSTKPFHLK